MGLLPEILFPTIYDEQHQPSRTYQFNIETGEIGPQIDGLAAIQQFITKAIHTIRFDHPIYSDDYGCELKLLLGKGYSEKFIKAELVRMITEALVYDDRIERVYEFDLFSTNDQVHISFKVDTVEGLINYKGVI